TKEAHPSWNVEVVNAGRYEVWVDYACPPEDAGSTVEVRLGSSALRAKITEGWYPPLLEQDVFPRKNGESVMREFKSVRLGDIDLSTGPAELTVKAVEMPGKTVMELRRITLVLK
ncbi:MAG: N-acetylgalactosamine 6-sulfate sulfatase, partial [Verrucomicrobiota bacterium]